MPKYDIPVIVQVECKDIDTARQAVYALLEDLAGDEIASIRNEEMKLAIANDEITAKDGRRVVLLHPADTDSQYDPATYMAKEENNDND
jgi:hypothetical protein